MLLKDKIVLSWIWCIILNLILVNKLNWKLRIFNEFNIELDVFIE